MSDDPHREFIRHTIDVPLEVSSVAGDRPTHEHGVNVSFGGLAFTSDTCLATGEIVHLRIPTTQPAFEAEARVAWCRPEGDKFLVGVQFLDSADAFQARMVQQVCSIENFRKQMEREQGRPLGTEAAALEWIRRYAARFPDAEIAYAEEGTATGGTE